MAWNDPKTWALGELVAADDMNTDVRDNTLLLKTAIDDDGKVRALNATYLADLSGAALTGVAQLAGSNDYTAGVQDFGAGASARLVLPTGPGKWGT